ncbi:MAG: imidazole glycerol phosphate synthase cyclase subunit [Pseudomonadota bacterium]|nr:imidazole glycerol phosphate synthase cyclase subunit [Pseudomonadota bacterium]
MKNFRIIARLDIKLESLIKGVQMEGWRKVGDPIIFAQKYALEGADELVFADVVASLYGRNTLYDIVKSVASKVFIPMTIGGGVRNLDDVKKLLSCGADKVSINTGVSNKPELIDEIAQNFGSQACVVAVDTIFRDGDWFVMTDNGRNHTGRRAIEWVEEISKRGAGEILLTAIHKEGLGKGMDMELIAAVCERVSIPVIAGGGVGDLTHFEHLLDNSRASAVALAQALHWNKLKIADLRSKLMSRGYFVRPLSDEKEKEL